MSFYMSHFYHDFIVAHFVLYPIFTLFGIKKAKNHLQIRISTIFLMSFLGDIFCDIIFIQNVGVKIGIVNLYPFGLKCKFLFCTIQIILHGGGIIVIHGFWCIENNRHQILLDIKNFSCIIIQALQYVFDMPAIYRLEPFFYLLYRMSVTCDGNGFSLKVLSLHHRPR